MRVAITRITMMRFISNGVPTNRNPSGKNSLIVGPWKLPSSLADGTIRCTAVSSSAISWFGAGRKALATTTMGLV